MSDALHQAVGEANGKLDTLLTLVRDHIEQDNERFENVGRTLVEHAADINRAKGAKSALIIFAGGIATAVSLAAAAVGKIFGGN